MRTIWLGAVAYDPKVVTIWEGMRSYFHDEAKLPVEILLFLSYEAQVRALLSEDRDAPRIDIAWNTNLAYLQSTTWSEGKCEAIAMRDTDLGWRSVLLALRGGRVAKVEDLKGKKLALGSRDSGHAAILPKLFLERAGLVEARDYASLRFDSDVGKHGDTGASEVEVLKAVLDGRADAGFVGSPFWQGVREKKLIPEGALVEVWSSPPYSHCMFTARVGLEAAIKVQFTDALLAMSFDNPRHRPILEAEGLKTWLAAQTDGYDSLREACERYGHFARAQAQ